MPSDSPTELEKFCKDHGVHEVLYQALALKGLESVDDFAYAFPEIRSLEALHRLRTLRTLRGKGRGLGKARA